MNRNSLPSHSVSGLFIFLMIGIFAVFSTVMVLFGANAYRGAVNRFDSNNESRIASSYIRSMLRADDEAGVLSVADEDGISCITMVNAFDDESYITRIYVYDGMLREWYASGEFPFEPEKGEPVCSADSMEAELRDGLLTVKITAGGEVQEIFYAPRTISEGEEAQ